MDLARLLSSSLAPAQSQIVCHFEPSDMLSLLRTSKSVHRSMKEAIAVAYSIDVRLKKFFDDPQAFRRVQAECNALITGNFARAFFANDLMPQRLCFLVDEDGAASIRAFIETNGFPLEKNISLIGPNNDPLFQEISACNRYKCAANGRSIYLFITTQTGVPLNALLCNSMSTGELSFISWNKAYALYPRHTFLEKETYLLQNMQTVFQTQHGDKPCRTSRIRGLRRRVYIGTGIVIRLLEFDALAIRVHGPSD